MGMEQSFFSFNKSTDWENGSFINTSLSDGALMMKHKNIYRETAQYNIDDYIDFEQVLWSAINEFGLLYILFKTGQVMVFDWTAEQLDESFVLSTVEDDINGEMQIKYMKVINNKLILINRDDRTNIEIYSALNGRLLGKAAFEIGDLTSSYYVDQSLNIYLSDGAGDIYKLSVKGETSEHVFKFAEPFGIKEFIVNDSELYILTHESEVFSYIFPNELIDQKSGIEKIYLLGNEVLLLKENNEGFGLGSEFYFPKGISSVNLDYRGYIYVLAEHAHLFSLYKNKEIISSEKTLEPYTGIYFTPVLDSYEYECFWDRLKIECHDNGNTQIDFDYFAFDHEKIRFDHKIFELQDFVNDSFVSLEDKQTVLNKYFQKKIVNPSDALFEECKGRFFIGRLKLWGTEDDSPVLNGMRIYFGRDSYMKYLPEIYQTSETKDFLERFIKILESFYEDIEEKIDAVSNFIDIDIAEDEFLRWLTTWVDFEIDYTWSTEKVRKLLKNMGQLNKKRGTLWAITEILNIYLGKEPIIIENHKVFANELNEELKGIVSQAYGESPYGFTVIVMPENPLTANQLEAVERILKRETPAFAHYRFIELKPLIRLNKESYLGINSVISEKAPLKLNDQSVLPFHSILDDDERI